MITNIIIARMPTSHIPNSMYPMLDGVSLFTERAKSFIQSAFPAGLIPTASPMAVLVPEVGELFRLLSHERICGNPIKRNGIKGTTNNPSSRNHRLYCIRLDRLPLNIRLAIHNDFINGKGESQWLERDKRFTEKFRGISKDTAYSAFKIRIGKPEERG